MSISGCYRAQRNACGRGELSSTCRRLADPIERNDGRLIGFGRKSLSSLFVALPLESIDSFVASDRFARIVLKNSKIEGLRKSRKFSALAILAAVRLCRIDTSASGRFCGN
jgi:hypothetical protein